MTDFGTPTTIAAALRNCAEATEYRIKIQEQKIRDAQVVVEALRHERDALLDNADRYERHQPKPAPDGEWGPLADGTPVHKDSYRLGVHDGQRSTGEAS